jgi:hypothetical protein
MGNVVSLYFLWRINIGVLLEDNYRMNMPIEWKSCLSEPPKEDGNYLVVCEGSFYIGECIIIDDGEYPMWLDQRGQYLTPEFWTSVTIIEDLDELPILQKTSES